VLCRKRSQFPAVVEALEAVGLPVEVVGLGGLLSTPEIADIVALLWVVQDPSRGDHLVRLLTGPALRLGAADLDGLATWSRTLLRRHSHPAGGGGGRSGGDAGPIGESGVSAGGGSVHEGRQPADHPRSARDQAPDSADRASIVEALDELPPRRWVDRSGARLSDVAHERLSALQNVVRGLRSMTGLPLAELVAEAERSLGLDVEVLARPEHTMTTARAHLDAFADVAATFSTAGDRPTLGGFLEWLVAAQDEERGLDKGYIEVSQQAVQVLTVHAAKGLEWDIVAVPGLTEGSFPARPSGVSATVKDGQWRVPDPSDRGWAGGLDGVPYPLRGDVDGLPELRWRQAADRVGLNAQIKDFVAAGGRHGVAEERRLAYVAFTRARRELLLTAPIWTDASTPRLTSDFLLELVDDPFAGVSVGAWEPLPDVEPKPVNPRQATPPHTTWPADPMAARRPALADGSALVAAEMMRQSGEPSMLSLPGLHLTALEREVDLLLTERHTASVACETAVRVPRHLSASALVQYARDPQDLAQRLRRPMPAAPAVAARRGTAFHGFVEQHFARAAMVDVLDLPGSADEEPGDDANLPVMKRNFLASEWAVRVPVEIEIAVETVLDGIAVRGRIDAVFPRPGGGFTVIDWKTGARPSGERAAHLSLQLAAYRLAFARLRGLPAAQVDAAFYYAATGETVYPALVGERELVQLLATIAE